MATSTPTAPDTGTTLDSSNSSATAELYRAAMGPVSAAHYEKAFTRFEAADGMRPGWNWAAALVTLNWMIYRRLWGPAMAYVALVVAAGLLVFGIGRLVFQFPPETEMALLGAFGLLTVVVPGLIGDGLAYKACRSRVQDALAANATLPEACAMLKGQAVTRGRLIAQAAINAVLAAVLVAGYMALPNVDSLPMESDRMAAARNVAVGRTLDLASPPASATSAAASAALAAPPASSASSASSASAALPPATLASAPTSVTASAAMAPASAPAKPASAPSAASGTAPTPRALPPLAPSPARPASAPQTSPPTDGGAAIVAPAVQGRSSDGAKPTGKPATQAATPKVATAKTVNAAANPAASSTAKTAAVADEPRKYLINVGLFADKNNALNAYTRLRDAEIPATSGVVRTPKGPMTRVRAGPFETEAEAERAAERIRELQLEAMIVRP